MLLSRNEFRNKVFERDGYCCVICGNGPNTGHRIDAHHIIERRLWSGRMRVVRMWRDNGIFVFDVYQGEEDF